MQGLIMKQKIHPKWFYEAKITCACGNSFTSGSTMPEIKVEICSKCHPLFTGQTKFIDTLGQVERFQVKTKKAFEEKTKREQIKLAKEAHARVEKDKPTLKDLLMQARKDLRS